MQPVDRPFARRRLAATRASLRAVVQLAAVLVVAACAPDGRLGVEAAPTVDSVRVSPASVALAAGETRQLEAMVFVTIDAQSEPQSGLSVSWSSSDEGVATVSSGGLLTAVAAGSATIAATRDGERGEVALTVVAAPPPPPPPGSSAVLVGAGDIARCGSSDDEATATLLDGITGTVFTAGDNVYENGTATEFANCYEPSWGRHKARTRPVAGNHDYNTSGATGYYDYFGAAAGERGKGYYSFEAGSWHVIVLNSNIGVSSGSAQLLWLQAELAGSDASCTLALWHHPRFSSGDHGNNSGMQPLWDALYAANADVIVNGHDHNYERFAPQTPTGTADAARGIREFVVGTGGTSLRGISTVRANSEYRDASHHGVLKLELGAGAYRWEFLSTPAGSVVDSGTGACH
jgi:hypothetical protein